MLGGGAGGGAVGQFPLEQWFYEMPVCTRWWTTATVAISFLVQCHIITPFQLFYSFRAVFVKSQVCLRSSTRSASKGDTDGDTNYSTGASLPHFCTSVHSPSTSSSTSSSSNATPAFSKSHPDARQRIFHGSSSMQPQFYSFSLPYSPCPSSARR